MAGMITTPAVGSLSHSGSNKAEGKLFLSLMPRTNFRRPGLSIASWGPLYIIGGGKFQYLLGKHTVIGKAFNGIRYCWSNLGNIRHCIRLAILRCTPLIWTVLQSNCKYTMSEIRKNCWAVGIRKIKKIGAGLEYENAQRELNCKQLKYSNSFKCFF